MTWQNWAQSATEGISILHCALVFLFCNSRWVGAWGFTLNHRKDLQTLHSIFPSIHKSSGKFLWVIPTHWNVFLATHRPQSQVRGWGGWMSVWTVHWYVQKCCVVRKQQQPTLYKHYINWKLNDLKAQVLWEIFTIWLQGLNLKITQWLHEYFQELKIGVCKVILNSWPLKGDQVSILLTCCRQIWYWPGKRPNSSFRLCFINLFSFYPMYYFALIINGHIAHVPVFNLLWSNK